MNEQKFFRCKHCGNLVGLIIDSKVPMVCCGEPMERLISNTSDGATEKHLPVITIKERLVHVEIGSTIHPMTAEHYINFIYLQTQQGGQMKRLAITGKPAAMFAVLDDTPVAAFAYCNLHGLWECEVPNDTEEEELTCSAEFSEGCK